MTTTSETFDPGKPLSGLLVVSLEQAVAEPYCSSRLADAGARVIKIERAEGDFARGYDYAVNGLATYFVWRGLWFGCPTTQQLKTGHRRHFWPWRWKLLHGHEGL
jgi:hypothetical protein